jgi:RNA polymerase sigma-70 factor (ECF subfamily)
MSSFKTDLIDLLPNLRAFARSLCGNPDWADDLVQEAIVRAWANQTSFQPGTNLKAWLFTILRNYFYNEIRKKKRSVELEGQDGTLQVGLNESQPAQLHLADLARELGKLSPEQREALILISVDGFSYEKAADICNCAVGTVKSRVARARKQLEARLGGPDIGTVLPRAAGGSIMGITRTS